MISRLKHLSILLVFLFSQLSYSKQNHSIKLSVERFKLENGLTVLLHQDRRIPLISFHTWYKVGSRHEREGVTGAAHMLEHMMFKGAKKYSGKEFDELLHKNGIVNNAFTSNDYTGFYQNLPSSKLELMMELEVDRMTSLAINPEQLWPERDVVKEERRWRVDNNPMGLLREKMMSTLFKKSEYRWPVIGHMKDISEYTPEKLREFYERYYIPNNAVLVLAGDFDIAEAKRLINKYYAPLKAKPLEIEKFTKEPIIDVPRKESIVQKVSTENWNIAFLGVPQGHKDMYALDILAEVLGGGSSSRMFQKFVVEKGTASQAYAYHYGMSNEGVFSLALQLKPGNKGDAEEVDVKKMIEEIKTKKFTQRELKQAQISILKGTVDSLQTMDAKARALAATEILTGSYENLFTDLDKYNSVTTQDLQRVAQKYLNIKQSSIIQLLPEEK